MHKKMRIYIVRHGETKENLQRILQGHLPGTLTEKGQEQVRQTAERLAKEGAEPDGASGKWTRIVSSDLKRAMDSALIIADRLHLPITPMEILRERDWGQFTGMAIAEATDRFRIDGRWQFPPGTTETEEGIYDRAGKALRAIKQMFGDETLIVVTHGQLARNLIAAHFGCSYHEVTPFANAEIRTIDI